MSDATSDTKRDRGGRRPRSGDAPWMEKVQFMRDGNRRIMSKRQNVYLMLKHDPMLTDLIAFDEIAQRVIVKRPVPVDDELAEETGFPKKLDGIQRSRLLRYLEKNPSLPKFSDNDIKGGIEDFADRAKFNSLADHLNGLKWDGELRMHRLFEHYFGATHDGPVTADGNRLLSRQPVDVVLDRLGSPRASARMHKSIRRRPERPAGHRKIFRSQGSMRRTMVH